MIEYASPITGLFVQIERVRPTSMACPPNIWAGLHEAAMSAVSVGGGRSAMHRQHETHSARTALWARPWAAALTVSCAVGCDNVTIDACVRRVRDTLATI